MDDVRGQRPFDGTPGSAELNTDAAWERALLRKVTGRLMPLLFVCYIIAYIDRINVGFARLQLREALGVDPAMWGGIFGLGAGLFFIGYFLFEVPSNLILQRVGARIWIARIMIVWGIVSSAMMFMKSVPVFYVMRFLLGAAEAGFFPGIILYLTYWYPAKERASTVALFATAAVISGILGSPISGAILSLNGTGGLAGWQWLFLLEGIPAVVLGLVVLLVLPNGPQSAKWLNEVEKAWLKQRLEQEGKELGTEKKHRLADAFTSSQVWLLCLMYFFLNVGGYGFELWSPSIIKGFGASDAMVGLINAIPYLVAAVCMLIVGRHSDRTGERRWHVALGATASAIGFGLSSMAESPYVKMAALTLGFVGLKCALGPFWALSTAFLGGTAAAGGIALINSVGNLGGFVGPIVVGVVLDRTGSNVAALAVLGAALLGMGLLALVLRNPESSRRPPVRQMA
jgi:D-galactonate transporter